MGKENRFDHTSVSSSSLNTETNMAQENKSPFEQAVEFVKNLPSDGDVVLSNETKLVFYGLYKRATVGKCSEKGGGQPWAVQIEARSKWDAWNAHDAKSEEEAMKAYVDELVKITKDSKDHKFEPK